jgi:hypothetical protein
MRSNSGKDESRKDLRDPTLRDRDLVLHPRPSSRGANSASFPVAAGASVISSPGNERARTVGRSEIG